MENILILGANGFIGTKLVESLLQQEHHVVGYEKYESSVVHEKYHHLCGDYCNEEDFARILRDHNITAVYHLICTTVPKEGTAEVEQEILQNLLPTVRLLEAAANCGVERVIFASSGGTVYGDSDVGHKHREEEPLRPCCSYGAQKAAVESYLQMYRQMRGLNTLTARISNPYGVCLQLGRTQGIIPILMQRLHNGEEITLYGDTVRDYIYIDDAIAALVKLLTYDGEESVFNIGFGEGTRLHDLVGWVEREMGKTFAAIHEQEIRKCDVVHSVLDNSLAMRELSWNPTTGLVDGIRKTKLEMNL